MRRPIFWGLFTVTLAVYGLMLGWSLPTIARAAGGLAPFDMRPGGYTLAEAQAFLSALSAEGAKFYLDIQQRLDIAYPALITLTLFFAIAALSRNWLGHWRWLPACTALPIAIFDYLENHAIAAMLKAGPSGLTPQLVATASQWTVLKSATTMLAMTVLLALLCLHAGHPVIGLWRRKTLQTAQ